MFERQLSHGSFGMAKELTDVKILQLSSSHWARGVLQPGQVTSLSQTTIYSHIHTYRQFRGENFPHLNDCGRTLV